MFNDDSIELIQSLGLFFSAACTLFLFTVNISLSSNIVFFFNSIWHLTSTLLISNVVRKASSTFSSFSQESFHRDKLLHWKRISKIVTRCLMDSILSKSFHVISCYWCQWIYFFFNFCPLVTSDESSNNVYNDCCVYTVYCSVWKRSR